MVIIIMGVSGAGKTTVGQLLAKELGWKFYDADDFHSAANKDKMSRGVPLTDEDRADWLASLRSLLNQNIEASQSIVLACSALKQEYQDVLRVNKEVHFVYLQGTYQQIRSADEGTQRPLYESRDAGKSICDPGRTEGRAESGHIEDAKRNRRVDPQGMEL